MPNVGFSCEGAWRGLGVSQGRAKRPCQVEALVMWFFLCSAQVTIKTYLVQFRLDNMSLLTYTELMNPTDKPLVWLSGEVRTPPMSKEARIEAGYLLRCLQAGRKLAMPHSRPMPSVGTRCHELRINDEDSTWRILYRLDSDAVLILEVFRKKTGKTPKSVIETCKLRAQRYDAED